MRKMIRTLAAVFAVVAAPAALGAQQGELPAEAQQLVVEMQQIQAQLQAVQQQALQDPVLQQSQEELGSRLREAMIEADPALPGQVERLAALQAEAQQAQAAQDQQRMSEIVAEAQEVERRVQAVQQQVMQRPELEAELTTFQSALEQKMLEVDADIEPLLARFKEINEQLARMLSSPGTF